MPTYFIHIAGRVQGVGFRPFVYRLANSLNIKGKASNEPDGVHIYVNGDETTIRGFYNRLLNEVPVHAKIIDSFINQIDQKQFEDFRIEQEVAKSKTHLLLTPDLAMCDSCRQEIKDESNLRYAYAFTTCTNCGPRYSIIEKLPYDRVNTTMDPFQMCPSCIQEYNEPTNRRYYSQTNSCPQCPVSIKLYDLNQNLITSDFADVINKTSELLISGQIVAVKGLGGYLLMADATDANVIKRLRARKHRPTKPFAIMYPSIELAAKDCFISEQEQELLLSAVSPIVLCSLKENYATKIEKELIAPKTARLGILLPYTPLFELILSKLNKPVIATSANTCNSHIIYQDQEAFKSLIGIADYTLVHDRKISVPLDDSVVKFSTMYEHKIIMRRSRGYDLTLEDYQGIDDLLALGADMKSSFAFTSEGLTHVSQYHGDLSDFDNQLNLTSNLKHLSELFQFKLSGVLTDKHPLYASKILGKRLAKERKISLVSIQHHEAHFAAVLAENQLMGVNEPVLGVIWDGTGYGSDTEVKGGEFFIYDFNEIATLNQIQSYAHLAGDKMAKEPRLAALALSYTLKESEVVLKSKFTKTEWMLYHQLLHPENVSILSTSMGRVFDAVASILGLCDFNSYEGEAATYLEQKASSYNDIFNLQGYQININKAKPVNMQSVIQQVLSDKLKGIPKDKIAAKFHVTLVTIIQKMALIHGIKKLAFSGGVFQNALLVDLLHEKLRKTHELYFHKQLSPNDECISFGQLAWMKIQEIKQVNKNKLTDKKTLIKMKCA